MLVTARFTDKRDGCIAQLLSKDLKTWELTEPFLIPGRVTDCPDFFEWNGYHYLFAEFVYWMSRGPLGPWTNPPSNRLDVLYVPKTAAFTDNRRIYVSWLPDGGWAGNAVFRELVQHEDGTLGTKFVSEMTPKSGDAMNLTIMRTASSVQIEGRTLRMDANATATMERVPRDMRLTMQVTLGTGASGFALKFHESAEYNTGCTLAFDPAKQQVAFHADDKDPGKTKETDCAIEHVQGLDRPFALEIVLKGDIMDVCIDNRRTIITRYKGEGEGLFFYAQGGQVTADALEVRPLAK
jgi:hypothetical protein